MTDLLSEELTLTDDDVATEWRLAGPTESEDDKDTGGDGTKDSGDEGGGPTEAEDDKDQGGDGAKDTGDK